MGLETGNGEGGDGSGGPSRRVEEEEAGEQEEVEIEVDPEYAAQFSVPEDPEADVDPSLEAVLKASEEGDSRALRTALRNLDTCLSSRGEDGDTPLHLASLYGHTECVQMLLEAGAPVSATDDEGALPLHDACASGHLDIVQLLLEAVGNTQRSFLVNKADSDGDTPLHCAARGSHPQVVELLLQFGADRSLRNTSRETPLMLADESVEVQRLLHPPAQGAPVAS